MSTPPDPGPEPFQQPPPGQWFAPAPPPPQHPDAAKVMGIGLFALIGGITCYLPILAAPFAWVMGRRTLREIDADPQRWSGRDLTNIGYITGIVATVLLVVGLLALGIGISLFVFLADTA